MGEGGRIINMQIQQGDENEQNEQEWGEEGRGKEGGLVMKLQGIYSK